ncbi:MAG: hypothetical protein JWM11_6367 [Planctomycetaceae bacterium]|nr:hypothetical protein [Planctomycetaceae bacterium]
MLVKIFNLRLASLLAGEYTLPRVACPFFPRYGTEAMIRTSQALSITTCQSLANGSTESSGSSASYGDEVDSWLDEIVMRDEFEEEEEFEDDDEDDEDEDDDDWDDDDDDWDDDEEEEEDDEDMSARPSKPRPQSAW